MFGHPLSKQDREKNEEGFTLVELLVVIAILGILAAIVVFSVQGIGSKGTTAAQATDVSVLRTAEEAYYAQNGHYATQAQLNSSGFLANPPTLDAVACLTTNPCSSFIVGSLSGTQPTSGALFYGASNTQPPFDFLQSDFESQPGNSSVIFSFSGSSTLASQVNTAGNTAALFASADEANVNAVIPTSDTTLPGEGTSGTCSTGTCPGLGGTKTLYAIGTLVAFSCKQGGQTLAPASNAPTCSAPSGGYLGSGSGAFSTITPPTTVAQIVSELEGNPTLKLAIAAPGGTPASCEYNIPGSGTPPSAPYGQAALEALLSGNANGGGLSEGTCGSPDTGSNLNTYEGLISDGQIIFGSNVTNTQKDVVSGAAAIALLPESFVESPAGPDTNNWTPILSCQVTNATQGTPYICGGSDPGLYNPIEQWVVATSNVPAEETLAGNFISYITSARAQSVLTQYGYQVP